MKLDYKNSVILLDPENRSIKHLLDQTVILKKWYPAWHCYLLPETAGLLLYKLFPTADMTDSFLELVKRQQKIYRDTVNIKEGRHELIDKLSIKGLKNKHLLRKYQKIGIAFAVSRKTVLIADEMGLGKAVMALASFLICKEKYGIKKALIVCPNSIKYSVWANEIKKWTRLSCTVVDGDREQRIKLLSNIKSTFVIINYEAIRSLYSYLKKWQPDMIILDECHAIKNRRAKQTLAIKEIDASYKILLTGTPVLNRVEELWSQLNYIDPLYWYSYNRFIKRYCTFKEQWLPHMKRKVKIISGYQNLEELQDHMYGYYIRRTKEEVLDELPERIYETRILELHPEQKRKYNELIGEYRQDLKITPLNRATITAHLQELLQLCDLLEEQNISVKLDECEKIYRDMSSSHKIVFFTWYVKTAQTLRDRLMKIAEENEQKVVEIDGSTKPADRETYINMFTNDKNCRALIATIATCGVGLNLTAGDVCVFVSRSFTPAINEQAEARLHRHGQKKVVNIITLLTKHTVEEKVEKILRTKKIMFNELFHHKEYIESLFNKIE